ncbi:hypothetical protein SRHO_G00004580 [Serrasalmus rhombeus]
MVLAGDLAPAGTVLVTPALQAGKESSMSGMQIIRRGLKAGDPFRSEAVEPREDENKKRQVHRGQRMSPPVIL